MRLTCYVGGQIHSVTESSTVLQDTNLQLTQNNKHGISYWYSKKKKKKKTCTANSRRPPIQMADFFVFRQCFLFQQWTVFPFFHKLFRLYFQQYNRNLVLYRRFTLNTWKYLDSFGYYSVLWCCMAYSTCVSSHKSINSHLIENTWQWWGRRGGILSKSGNLTELLWKYL